MFNLSLHDFKSLELIDRIQDLEYETLKSSVSHNRVHFYTMPSYSVCLLLKCHYCFKLATKKAAFF